MVLYSLQSLDAGGETEFPTVALGPRIFRVPASKYLVSLMMTRDPY